MQQLNRIILMNSATVPYQEIELDGNIHFIGTQGVGKSTVLRAILFFYIADTRRLGLSKEQKSFAEYYFPYVNSYIAYEVQKGERLFTVWLLKKQNRLAFRFIDGAFRRDCFIGKNQVLNEEEAIARLTQSHIQVGKPITNFTEYRNMLYGAARNKQRYSLMESKTYQNIPRTISNVFMNSSLDASFIKRTIIHSLSDEPYAIDLETHRHHISRVQRNYYDILEYKKHHQRVANIIKQYEAYLELQEQIKRTAWQLGAAYNHSRSALHEINGQINDYTGKISGVKEQLEKARSNAEGELQTLRNKLAVQKENLKKARELDKKYKELDIENLLAEYNQKDHYANRKKQLQDQLNHLTEKSGSLKAAYDNQLRHIELNTREANQKLESRIAAEREDYHTAKDQITAQYDARMDELREEEKERLEELLNAIHQQEREIDRLKGKEEQVRSQSFRREEQEELSGRIIETEKRLTTLDHEIQQINQREKTEQVKAEQQEKELENKYTAAIDDYQRQIQELAGREQTLQRQLDQYSNTLLEYLEQNKPGWRDDIGKVAGSEILLHTGLEPKQGEGNSLYGIRINTDKLEASPLSRAYLREQLEKAAGERKSLGRELEKTRQNKEEESSKLQKKINKAFRDLKKEREKKQYEREQQAITLESLRNEQQNLKEKAEGEREQALAEVRDKIAATEQALSEDQQKHKQEKEAYEKSLEKLEQQKKEQTEGRAAKRDKAIREWQKKIRENEEAASREKEEVTQQRDQALQQKGVDTQTLRDLEQQIKELDEALHQIEQYTQTVMEYWKDHREYLSQVDHFKQNRDHLSNKLQKREARWKEREEGFNQQIRQKEEEKRELEKQRDHHQRQVNKMDDAFRQEELYQELRNYIENSDKHEKEDVETIIDKLRNQKNSTYTKAGKLREQIANFAGFFGEDNTLQLPVKVQTDTEMIDFAEMLKDIEDNQKITDMELDVTKKYAMMINHIGKDTDELFKKEEEIQKVVSRMNTDFRNSNFVGVVRSIEMRLQEGADPIIDLLRRIQDFRRDHMFAVGETNLFSQNKDKSGNNKAVEMLEELDKRIRNHKERWVSIENAFELEFRIRENENDTGWVSRLANVGSHGTDILVKSMIYINLLNIFKKREAKKNSDTRIHCLIDEVGILHDTNVRGLINFAAERDIFLINSSPNSHNEEDYKHIYQFSKDPESNKTEIFKLLSNTV